MSLKCGHCGGGIIIHRNLVLHESPEGCMGKEHAQWAVNIPRREDVQFLVNEGKKWISGKSHLKPSCMHEWNVADWRALWKDDKTAWISLEVVKHIRTALRIQGINPL